MENLLQLFINQHETEVKPLYAKATSAYFNSTISGKQDDYDTAAELQIKLTKLYTQKEDFEKLKKFKEHGNIKNPVLKRQLDVLYLSYLGNQADEKKLEESIRLGTEIENKFSTFRAEVNGIKLTDNEIEDILHQSTNSDELKKVWEASKKIGTLVADDVKKIVKLRNEMARELGYSNYHDMSLRLAEQYPEQIDKIFDELDVLTQNSFVSLKDEIDTYLSSRYKIKKEALRPWHYQNRFFQEAPKIYAVDLDGYYKNKDIVDLAKKFYNGIGLSIDPIVEKSDLYEKEGKYQHAYCTDIDREGDVRMVCNIKPNAMWMNTMLHECGHGVYDLYINHEVPYLLRTPAHIFTTEAIAMMFGRFAGNPQWLKDMVGISEEEKQKISEVSYNTLKLEQLVFSRWAQVMYRFEKSMYAKPEQDLNKLWWDLVEKYQMIKRPETRNEPDWASKIHIATAPCYYHNYLLGELLASQLFTYISKQILKTDDIKNQSFVNKPEVGKYLTDKVFNAANYYYWNDMIEKATGEKLTAKYYASQFVD